MPRSDEFPFALIECALRAVAGFGPEYYTYDGYFRFCSDLGLQNALPTYVDDTARTRAGATQLHTTIGPEGLSVVDVFSLDHVHSNEWVGQLESMALDVAALVHPRLFSGLGIRHHKLSLDPDGARIQGAQHLRHRRLTPGLTAGAVLDRYSEGQVRGCGTSDRAHGFRDPTTDAPENVYVRQVFEQYPPGFVSVRHHSHWNNGIHAYVSPSIFNAATLASYEFLVSVLRTTLTSATANASDIRKNDVGIRPAVGPTSVETCVGAYGGVAVSNELPHLLYAAGGSGEVDHRALAAHPERVLAALTALHEQAQVSKPNPLRLQVAPTQPERDNIFIQLLLTDSVEARLTYYLAHPEKLHGTVDASDPVEVARDLSYGGVQLNQAGMLATMVGRPDLAREFRSLVALERQTVVGIVDITPIPYKVMAAGGLLATFELLATQLHLTIDRERVQRLVDDLDLVVHADPLPAVPVVTRGD